MDDRLEWIIRYNTNNNNEYKNYIFYGKYLAIRKEDHHKADKNGYVYIHFLQAEKLLNRELRDNECIHHIDKNKFNNDINNLMVFKTKADHSAFHLGANIFKQDDVWVADIIEKKDICPICKINYKCFNAKKCLECYEKEKTKNIPPKEELEKYIYNTPFTRIGEKYGVTDGAVRKWCKKYDLPYRRKDIIQYNNKY